MFLQRVLLYSCSLFCMSLQFTTDFFRLLSFIFAAYLCHFYGNAFYTLSLFFQFIFPFITIIIIYLTPFESTVELIMLMNNSRLYFFYFQI